MGRARVRALTQMDPEISESLRWGRNGESPSKGIDTLCHFLHIRLALCRRNGDSPSKGIDTFFQLYTVSTKIQVEMGTARDMAFYNEQKIQCILSVHWIFYILSKSLKINDHTRISNQMRKEQKIQFSISKIPGGVMRCRSQGNF